MSKSVDSIFAGMTEAHRGLVALGSVGMIALSLGFALGSMGLREDVEALRQADERITNDISTNRSTAAAISSQVTSIESLIQRTGLVDMSERVRRIDRELCLLRADRAGTVTSQMQQECARR
jgi:alanine dehydrogenase